MIVLESELIRVNSENWKLVCEHLNNLEISQEDTLYLPVIAISQISVSNGSHCQNYIVWRLATLQHGLANAVVALTRWTTLLHLPLSPDASSPCL